MMKCLNTFSLVCYILGGILGLTFAMIYLTHDGFMPYHADAVGKEWTQVDEKMQILIIALMRVSGGGWLATTIAMFFFLYARIHFRIIIFSFALVSTALASLIPTILVTLYVSHNSKGEPPWYAAAIGIVVLLMALYFDVKSPATKKIKK
jgi:hypothetical protein